MNQRKRITRGVATTMTAEPRRKHDAPAAEGEGDLPSFVVNKAARPASTESKPAAPATSAPAGQSRWSWFDPRRISIIAIIDELLWRAARWRSGNVSEDDWIQMQADAMEGDPVSVRFHYLDTVDAKCSALLAHVSMMIGVLSVFTAIFADNKIERGVTVIEILFYVLIAIGCLRAIRIIGPHSGAKNEKTFHRMLHREALFRREVFRLCSESAAIVTLTFLVTAFVGIFI